MENPEAIKNLTAEIQSRYDRAGKPMGFGTYLNRFLGDPTQQCRGAAHYIRDTFDHFGVDKIASPIGERRRFRMFDAESSNGVGRVAGQEQAQEAIYRLLNNFVREGRVNRLILLHGPNGSAKTSLIRAIVQGMETYAATDAGALFRFRWVFPTEKAARGAIGFGEQSPDQAKELDTFAHLPGDAIDAVLECELKDHPLLLIPVEQRQALLERLKSEGALDRNFPIPDYLWRGDLCSQCRKIHDALLASYGGDGAAVMRHVQVGRLHLSGRYRSAVSIVEPQMHVDAAEQQVTASRGLTSLPRAISHLDLFQPKGPLVDANRGLLEYNDLLKRHIDTFKYLLVTCESSQVALERSTLFLDSVFIGSTNEMLLDAFKEYADFASFKGRLEFVRVPYLRRISDEVKIYQDQVPQQALGRHLAPHTLDLAALWAVLTRLRKPTIPAGASKELEKVISELSPIEKAKLFDQGEIPTRVGTSLARELAGVTPDIFKLSGGDYEGHTGASARVVRMVLMNTAQREDRCCVSPLALFAELRDLLTDKSVFTFLQIAPDGDYLDQAKILQMVDKHYLDLLSGEAAEAMGLVIESSYQDLFARYVSHVSHWLRKEKLTDPITKDRLAPSDELMADVESIIRSGDDDAEAFRKNLISRVGAYALETERNGEKIDGKLDYARVFPAMFGRLRADFVDKRKEAIGHNLEYYLAHMDDQKQEPAIEKMAVAVHANLTERRGYCDDCAQEAMAYLLTRRFSN